MSNEFNIKSSTVEKGLELAKDFLGKLITPAVEETGLLIKDQVTFWRFKNQVKILNKAEIYCEKHNIKPKKISFKLLTPLLENSSLEEDEVLQDKWAILLSNLVDSDQNIENHVFPYILGQISKKEFLFIEKLLFERKHLELMQSEIDKDSTVIKEIIHFIRVNYSKIEQIKENNINDIEIAKLKRQNRMKRRGLLALISKRRKNIREVLKHVIEEKDKLEKFELSNLSRLGLIKEKQETIAKPYTLEIPGKIEREQEFLDDVFSIDLDIKLESTTHHLLTELGELLLKVCSEKE